MEELLEILETTLLPAIKKTWEDANWGFTPSAGVELQLLRKAARNLINIERN